MEKRHHEGSDYCGVAVWISGDELESDEALIDPQNITSVKLLEQFNFVREGLLREYEYGKGKFDDVLMYGLLNKDN